MRAYTFSSFIQEQWGTGILGRDRFRTELKQHKALSLFRPSHINDWFLGETSYKPSREKIFRLALSLHFDKDTTNNYLIHGNMEPGININDYRECLFCFGLIQKISYKECLELINLFESKNAFVFEKEQHTHTKQLWDAFYEHCDQDTLTFFEWMCKNASLFKGYSRTVWNYFIHYKNSILSFRSEEAKKRLYSILSETNYYSWAQKHARTNGEDPSLIRQFIKNDLRRKNPVLSQEQIAEIREWLWIAYAPKKKNRDLISVLYAPAINKTKLRDNPFTMMNDSYLSDLMNSGSQIEKYLALTGLYTKLSNEEEGAPLPEWCLPSFKKLGVRKTPHNTSEAKKILQNALFRQRKRCQQIQREDILPLILTVAQNKYMSEHTNGNEFHYVQKDARNTFLELANTTFHACHMAPINSHYEMDGLMLSCFQKEHMYSFADLFDEDNSFYSFT